ncbi:M64 family metallopeptidase [Streptomyces sp. NPDC002659]|uniref:M64 family metallopeptidase n=1 Tax=Streptomyces sp. NPDC002659 TaxID=3364656 RepID=UPI0036A0BE9F
MPAGWTPAHQTPDGLNSSARPPLEDIRPKAAAAGTAELAAEREVFSQDGTITRVRISKQVKTAAASANAKAAAAEVTALQNTGPSASRFDMVIVGDGYTASQAGLLRQHAQAKWNEIAATAPWNKYRQLINVWLVNVRSNESGVDNDPSPGINRDTALDMRFFCDGRTDRLLCVDEPKAQAYAAQAPGVDAILAVGNTTKYGGAGAPSLASVSGGNAQSGRIAIHELGHSVGGLADEYFTEGTTYPGGEPREPNVTTDPRGTKWASDLGRNTPDGGVIGAYQGGRYYERGIYRPSQDSLMRNINKPFNLIGLVAMERAISSKIR